MYILSHIPITNFIYKDGVLIEDNSYNYISFPEFLHLIGLLADYIYINSRESESLPSKLSKFILFLINNNNLYSEYDDLNEMEE